MTPTQPFGARARFALRLVGVLAVVAGVIGMHGLANHGVTGMEAMGHPVVATDTPGDTAPATLATADALLGATVTLSPTMPAGMDMEMAGWCIAILMMGLGALTLLLRGKALSRAPLVMRLSCATPVVAGRDPDPPSLRRLSIQRC